MNNLINNLKNFILPEHELEMYGGMNPSFTAPGADIGDHSIYEKFFKDVSKKLYCILDVFKTRTGKTIDVDLKDNGMYLNIAPNYYVTIHSTIKHFDGNYQHNRFHIKQGDETHHLQIYYLSGDTGPYHDFRIKNRDERVRSDIFFNGIKSKPNGGYLDTLIHIIQECVEEYNREESIIDKIKRI